MERGRSQLQMMLLQQAGPGLLPLSSLSPEEFLGFLRKVDQLIFDERLAPVLVYWSNYGARRLLPDENNYRRLMRECFHISIFSEERSKLADEWCFLMEGQGLCLIVCGQQSDEQSSKNAPYHCLGSVDPQIVRFCFSRMMPQWQALDPTEAERLEEARRDLGKSTSSSQLIQRCKSLWPVIKMAPKDKLVLKPTTEFSADLAAQAMANIVEQSNRSATEVELTQLLAAAAAGTISVPDEELDMASDDPEAVNGSTPALAKEQAKDKPGDKAQDKSDKTSRERQAEKGDKAEAKTGGAPADALPSGEDLEALFNEEESAPIVISRSEGVFPAQAQEIIRDIFAELRQSHDLHSILQVAIERLTSVGNADRGVIWQIKEEELVVTNEFSQIGSNIFSGCELTPDESSAIVMDFIQSFPDESGQQVISIPDTASDTRLRKIARTLSDLIELGGVKARLVAQLRCGGKVSGFLEVQKCGSPRTWSDHDATILQCVAEVLSVVVKQANDQQRIERDANQMKLLNEIASLFRKSSGQGGQATLIESVRLVAQYLGFRNSQIYLFNLEENSLVPQINNSRHDTISLGESDNPFVRVFKSGQGQCFYGGRFRKQDPIFASELAVVVPMVSEGETLGVLGLWQRETADQDEASLESDKNIALAVSGHLASNIRADEALKRLREDQRRENLINRVSSRLREVFDEVSPILEALAESLNDYFGLSLCVVSHFESQQQDFGTSKGAGDLRIGDDSLVPNFGEQLILASQEELKAGQFIRLDEQQLKEKLWERHLVPTVPIKMAILQPLMHHGEFKAAVCMLFKDRANSISSKDKHMLEDLAERVAGEIKRLELKKELELQAQTDPMTGLYNRRYFQEQMSKELDRYQRSGRPFSYVITDLDYLKKINDSLGHQFGDAAIKHIANVIKKTIRQVDTAARYGGEEFVILLPDAGVQEARIAAERICSAIREKPVEGIGTVTASLGVATFAIDATERDHLTELADQALYLSKHRGRNQVCSVSEDLMPSLEKRGEEALEVQKAAIRAKAEEMATIDLKLFAEHGILGIMGAIIKIIEAKDAYSKDRSPRAAEYASRLALALRLSKEHVTIISLAAVLNNVGKIALPEEILRKQGPLTPEERKIVEQSPSIGAKILEPAKHLHRVASVIEAYHEHWDGNGYPKKLKGEEIPLESRIISLVDAFIAMTSDRPYRKALSHEQAVELIREGSGVKWDPRLVKLFLAILDKEGKKSTTELQAATAVEMAIKAEQEAKAQQAKPGIKTQPNNRATDRRAPKIPYQPEKGITSIAKSAEPKPRTEQNKSSSESSENLGKAKPDA